MVTVDLPVLGRRERDLRTGFEIPEDVPVPAFLRSPRARPADQIDRMVDNTLTWHDLEWLRSTTTLPILVKGILGGRRRASVRVGRRGRRRVESRRPPARRGRRVTRCAARGRGSGRRQSARPFRQRHSPWNRRPQGARARCGGGSRRPRAAVGLSRSAEPTAERVLGLLREGDSARAGPLRVLFALGAHPGSRGPR